MYSFKKRIGSRHRRGIFLPIVLVGILIIGILFAAFHQMSRSARHKVSWNADRLRARYIAESALNAAAAAILQNDFEKRWYRDGKSEPNGKYGGFTGSYEGKYGKGTFRVVAEDIVCCDNFSPSLEEGKMPDVGPKPKTGIKDLTYNRIDLFAEGVYGNYKVVAYQALVLMPEELVYKSAGGDSSTARYSVR